MPRNVRNFWLDFDVDGKEKALASGPKNATGGFSGTISLRESGGVGRRIEIRGRPQPDGTLKLWINLPDGDGVEIDAESRRVTVTTTR